MKKAMLFILFLSFSALTYADEIENTIEKTPPNAGNTNCPVSGKPINGVDSYVHNGTEYNLCSNGCKITLAENPEKFISAKPQN
jgi:YHS domain-containing protein